MKKFLLEDLHLLSHKERSGRHVRFHPSLTLIRGENDTGKSSIIKSIYRCLGADPPITHPSWKSLDVHGALKFSLDGKPYYAVHNGRTYGIFDGDRKLLKSASRVTRDLAPYLAELFDFRLVLPDRDEVSTVPTPNYQYLPFYIDQDRGWSKQWDSFARLGQFSSWKKDVAEYHAGLRPNAYYVAKTRASERRRALEEPLAQERAVKRLQEDLAKRPNATTFDINIDAYKNEIAELLDHCNRLRSKQEDYKAQLLKLESSRSILSAQVEIVARVEKEILGDYEHAAHTLPDDVECPTCGAHYENSFAERFDIAKDDERCVQLLDQLHGELSELDGKITSQRGALIATTEELASFQEVLDRKQGDVTLRTLIENEGKRELRALLVTDLEKAAHQIARLEAEVRTLEEQMKKYDNKDHKRAVHDLYYKLMGRFLLQLSVANMAPENYKHLNASISETGSDLPRAIIAYTYAMLHVKRQYGSSTFFPIVIDSPNQQDQDRDNHEKLLEFIRSARPEGSQLVLGLVDPLAVQFEGTVVELGKKYSALEKSSYASVAAQMRDLEQQL